MQILHCQKNKKINITDEEQGFTLIECILAIGILSIVVASIVGLQSSIISVAQISSDNLRATWAARSTIAQLQYVIDTQGQANIPEKTNIPWKLDNKYSIEIKRTELKDVKISQFLTSSLDIYNLVSPSGNENLDVAKMLGAITTILDSSANSNPKGFFSNVIIQVNWTSGTIPKNITEGFFLMDKDTFSNVTLPDFPDKNKGQK